MGSEKVSRASGIALVVLSLAALLLVLVFGFVFPQRPPPADEGAPAHLFQLIIVTLVPVSFVYLATADWRRPRRSVRPPAIAAVIVTLAFVALYVFEHAS